MNMWAVSALPVYSVERDTRRKGEKKPGNKPFTVSGPSSRIASSLGFPPKTQQQQPEHQYQQYHSYQQQHQYGDVDSLTELLEPAIDGPPSPESIRALSTQMKRANVKEKHQSHQTTSSGSSSLRSLASADRPSWENTLDGLSLSRKSSGRSSNTSNMPSRDRPESVQIFGKAIFNRRGKLKRESTAQSSSGGSLYSGDVNDAMLPPAPTSVPMRDSTIPAFFSRRRAASKATEQVDDTASRKFHISEPYNFQHVTHTNRDYAPEVQRASRASQGFASGMMRGARLDDMHFADFSSDNLPLNEEDEMNIPSEPHTRITLSRPPSLLPKHSSPPRRLVKHTRSQEQLRAPPPRPPRSPIEQAFIPAPPVPPPRVSSRTSMRNDGFDALGSGAIDRPHTAGSFRHPQPLSMAIDNCSPPATSHGYLPAPDMDAIPEHALSRFSAPDDANWPLPCSTTVSFDSTLPNVPEEEEAAFLSRQSRASLASNHSLRISQSVPMLRPMSVLENGESRRRSSGASDTLGRFDMFAAQRALRAALLEGSGADTLPRESWEDDIDYCYEHAAEADCDFAWERPSFDQSRECDSITPVDDQVRRVPSCEVSPSMLTPGQFDLPALSPASQASSTAGVEAVTPTALGLPRASNFSLPRVEAPNSKNFLHVRKPSNASSFKESHGFTLSPSLLIPQDFQEQMAASEAEVPDARELSYHPYDGPIMNMDNSGFLAQNRASASTTATFESARSGFERHISTASSSTDLTRMTTSTSSLDMENCAPKAESLHRFPSFEFHSRAESKSAMPTLPESEEVVSAELTGFGARPPFLSRGSDPNLVRLAMDGEATHKRKDSIQARRGRARTTSLSTPPPPNQYALFPSVQMSGSRI
ncbi:hypothetical protein B0H66DRAFT_199699 [Apodospora peruviana]|uniref:CRIB domain-containing protein n=1 Tax=Apodospora peruviana TaxID=516989 RepID=A0AAE0IC83_9PEZI|nr:hypothetical protein B0H66DRAFT_199699 [Apodospora peruviana]